MCSAFVAEVHKAVSLGNHLDVVVRAFGGKCTNCPACKSRVDNFVAQNHDKYHKILIYTGTCVDSVSQPYSNVKVIKSDLCFDLIIPRSVSEFFISKGYYLINTGKLRRIDNLIKEWGFSPEMSASFFAESANGILLIETGTDPNYKQNAQYFSKYSGLPVEELNTGVDYCKLLINEEILQWRDEKAQSELFEKLAAATTKTADYAMVFQQINTFVQISDEEEIISKIFELINMLFGPQNIAYYPYSSGHEGDPVYFRGIASTLEVMKESDFSIELHIKQDYFGRFDVFGLTFPQYIENYQYSAQIIANVCALAIANARKFKALKETNRIAEEFSNELKISNAEKDKFFSIIAHDLRSPFTGFLLFSQMLAEQTDDLSKEEINEYGRNMYESANNLFSLLENLLQWARMKRGVTPFKPERYELFMLADQAIELHSDHSMSKTIIIENKIPEDLFVVVDILMISSVVRNLLTNAVKFTPRGGRVSIECAIEADKQQCVVTVADSGIGMSEELISRLFKIDERVSREGTEGEPSTGLGLLLCKEFIDKHGCRIWAESTQSQGSRFSFTLPLASDE